MTAVNELRRQWGRNIKVARIVADYERQEDFADALHVTRQAVSAWERGAAAPRDEMKVRIALLVNRDVADLFPLNRGVAA